MPTYPNIDFTVQSLDPRGFYLNLTHLASKKKKLDENQKIITAEFLGNYQKSIFDRIEQLRNEPTSEYYKRSLRYVQIHNEFLFFAKRNLQCTNSYIKIWEMLSFMLSADILPTKGKLLMFFDAEFPGNFVKGTDNFLANLRNIELDWLASSLIPCEENTALEDVYGFYKNHPDRWLMTDKISGDVTDSETYKYHLNYINDYTDNVGVDMYVCDLGIQHNITNFHIQERINIIPQLCAVLKGLSILRKGGILLCKIFSSLEEDTRKMLAMLQDSFETVYLCKPSSSRGRNKELYIISYGYSKKYSQTELYTHFINRKSITSGQNFSNYYQTAVYASQFFTFRQLTWLEKMGQGALEIGRAHV
jgi:hypothetical protein